MKHEPWFVVIRTDGILAYASKRPDEAAGVFAEGPGEYHGMYKIHSLDELFAKQEEAKAANPDVEKTNPEESPTRKPKKNNWFDEVVLNFRDGCQQAKKDLGMSDDEKDIIDAADRIAEQAASAGFKIIEELGRTAARIKKRAEES